MKGVNRGVVSWTKLTHDPLYLINNLFDFISSREFLVNNLSLVKKNYYNKMSVIFISHSKDNSLHDNVHLSNSKRLFNKKSF